MTENVIGQVWISEQGVVVPLIHYAYQTGKFAFRRNIRVPVIVMACQPSLKEMSGWWRSDDVRAVSCPACKQTTEYNKVASEVRAIDKKWKG